MGRIIVAFNGEEARKKILRLLTLEGLEGVPCAGGAEVLRTVRRLGSAVVVCGFYLSDMTADALAEDLRGLAVVLVVAKAAYLELCGGKTSTSWRRPSPRRSSPPPCACCWTAPPLPAPPPGGTRMPSASSGGPRSSSWT